MKFELSPNESVSDGIRRTVTAEIQKALDHSKIDARAKDEDQVVAVHEVRKCFKRIRAALRLVRGELGEHVYRAENSCFRDAARPLTELRDAQVLVATLDNLRIHPPPTTLRQCLVDGEQAVTRKLLLEGHAFEGVQEVAREALGRVPTWKIERDGWGALEDGARRVYRAGRDALALAEDSPTVEHLHELRKQAKYLWHVLQLLGSGRSGRDEGLEERAHELSRSLGDDHDLAVLRQTLEVDPAAYGLDATREPLFSIIAHRREELRAQSLFLAGKLYSVRPRDFADRIATYWKASADGVRPTPTAS